MPDQTLETTSMPMRVEQSSELKGIRADKSQGTLNSAAAPMSVGEIQNDLVYVDITLPEAAANGDMSVSFDGQCHQVNPA